MDLYHVALFVHVVGAIVVIGATLLAPLFHAVLARTDTVSSLRNLAWVNRRIVAATGPAAGLLLIAGLYMTFARWSFADGWILVALALFAADGVMSNTILDPHSKRLLAAAEDAPVGPLSDDLERLIRAPRPLFVERVMIGTGLAIVFLMTNKPGWAASLTVAAVGISLGVSFALAARRGRRPVPVAPAA